MSSLGNNEITRDVKLLVDAYLKGVKTRPQDKPLIDAGTRLVINFLQNLNDIAYAASNLDVTIANRGS